MMYEGVLRYGGWRYLWWGLALIAISTALYATQGGTHPARGDTWQGYTLGTIAALLVVWLTLLGIRKRRYASGMGSVQGWTSAHIYLGLAVVAIATLHCAANFHWNVHTFAYVLMCIVVLSGMLGMSAYLAYPRRLAANREGGSRSHLFAELFDLDKQGRTLAQRCDPRIAAAVKSSIERTTIGGGVLRQLFAIDRSLYEPAESATAGGTPGLMRNIDQRAVINLVAGRVARADRRTEPANLQALVLILCRRQTVLRRIRRDIQLQGWMKVWLYVHVPLTIATLAALIVHILTSFLYW
jgi:hypothetical protein